MMIKSKVIIIAPHQWLSACILCELHSIIVNLLLLILVHLTPASSECTQLWLVVCVQLVRVDSVPVQWTLSMTMIPVPWPKYALP